MKLPIPSWNNKTFTSSQAQKLFEELSCDEKFRSLTKEEKYWLNKYQKFLSKN